MKNYLLLSLLFLLSLVSNAQTNIQTIKVNASAFYIDMVPTYKATVALSAIYSSYASENMNLDEMKALYKSALETKNISWSAMKENPNDFGFESLRHDKAGIIFEYTTSSIKEMKLFLTVKSIGVQQMTSSTILNIEPNLLQKTYKIVLELARIKAEAISFAMNKKLGEIIKVEDHSYEGTKIETSIYYDRPSNEYRYNLEVEYVIK